MKIAAGILAVSILFLPLQAFASVGVLMCGAEYKIFASNCVHDFMEQWSQASESDAHNHCDYEFCRLLPSCCDSDGNPSDNLLLIPGTFENRTGAPMYIYPGGPVCMPGESGAIC